MNKEKFWSIIETSRKNIKNNDDICNNLLEKLSRLSTKDLLKFQNIFGIYLQETDTPTVYIASKIINGKANDDTMLYFGAWLISQGERAYFQTLKNPDHLAKRGFIENAEFQQLLNTLEKALYDSQIECEIERQVSEEEEEEIRKDIITNTNLPYDEKQLQDKIYDIAPKLAKKYTKRTVQTVLFV